MIGTVTTNRKGDSVQYGYKENAQDSTFSYSLTIDSKNDSVLIYDDGGEICHLIGVKNYNIQNERVKIRRYLYDVAGVFDEEAEFFFVDNYGLIAIDVFAGNQLFFDKGPGSGRLIIERLRKDTVFFSPRLPPPPLPIDYNPSEIEAELDTVIR